jgi:hypothetical protein
LVPEVQELRLIEGHPAIILYLAPLRLMVAVVVAEIQI